jgi:hypothetical protein
MRPRKKVPEQEAGGIYSSPTRGDKMLHTNKTAFLRVMHKN